MAEEKRIYSKVTGYVLDENRWPLKNIDNLVISIDNFDCIYNTEDGSFEFSQTDITEMAEGVIFVRDDSASVSKVSIYQLPRSYQFTSALKTRINVQIIVPWKNINSGDVNESQIIDRPITFNMTNKDSDLLNRLEITVYDREGLKIVSHTKDEGTKYDDHDYAGTVNFNWSPSSKRLTCTLQYGFYIIFHDPEDPQEYYNYKFILAWEDQNNHNIELQRIKNYDESPFKITVIAKDSETKKEIDKSIVSLTLTGENYIDFEAGIYEIEVYEGDIVVVNAHGYISKWFEVEDRSKKTEYVIELDADKDWKNTDEWHKPELAVPWYVDRIDLKYVAMDMYSSRTEAFQTNYINTIPYTQVGATSSIEKSVVLRDQSTRMSKVNPLLYNESQVINENIYQFSFDLYKECYPVEYVKAENTIDTLELHTFIPTTISVSHRSDASGSTYQYEKNTKLNREYLNITYNGDDRTDINDIITMTAYSFMSPRNIISLTSNRYAEFNDVYISPKLYNSNNSGGNNIPISEKEENIKLLSVVIKKLICHSENFEFLDNNIRTVEFIYQKNASTYIGPLYYNFQQDDTPVTQYPVGAAQQHNFIPSMYPDSLWLENNLIIDNIQSEKYGFNNNELVITHPVTISKSNGTGRIEYHLGNEAPKSRTLTFDYSINSAPQITVSGLSLVTEANKITFGLSASNTFNVTSQYFADPGNADDYQFVLYSKHKQDMIDHDVKIQRQSYKSYYTGGNIVTLNTVSLSSVNTKYGNLMYSFGVNETAYIYQNTYISVPENKNILGTKIVSTNNNAVRSIEKYSYVNEIINKEDIVSKYYTDKGTYIYNVDATDKYNGYIILSNGERIIGCEKSSRWNNSLQKNKVTTTDSSTQTVKSVTLSDLNKSFAAAFMRYNPDTTGGDIVYMPKNVQIPTGNIYFDGDITESVKNYIDGKSNHQYIFEEFENGKSFFEAVLLSDKQYIGPILKLESQNNNSYKIEFGNVNDTTYITNFVDILNERYNTPDPDDPDPEDPDVEDTETPDIKDRGDDADVPMGIAEGIVNYQDISNEITLAKDWFKEQFKKVGKSNDALKIKIGTITSETKQEWMNITSNIQNPKVNVIRGNGFNIYYISPDIIKNLIDSEYHIKYNITTGNSTLGIKDIYSDNTLTEFTGTVYVESGSIGNNAYIQLYIYYYDMFIGMLGFNDKNNLLQPIIKTNNIGYKLTETGANDITLTFDYTSLINNTGGDEYGAFLGYSIELYFETGNGVYGHHLIKPTDNTLSYEIHNINTALTHHIKYRLIVENEIYETLIKSEYENFIYYTDISFDGYSHNSQYFTLQELKLGSSNINTQQNNIVEMRLYVKDSYNRWFVSDKKSDGYDLTFKLARTVNGNSQSVTPDIATNFIDYSLTIIKDNESKNSNTDKYILVTQNE